MRLVLSHTQRQLRERRRSREALEIEGQNSARCDDVEADEGLQIATGASLKVSDPLHEQIESASELVSWPPSAARKHRHHAVFSRCQAKYSRRIEIIKGVEYNSV